MSDARKHSIVSPSSAARWLACAPSALLAEKYGNNETSVYAEEGTLAHHFAELQLTDFVKGREWMAANPGKPYEPAKENPEAVAALAKAKTNPLYYAGMLDEVRIYTDHVVGLYGKARPGAKMIVEWRVPLFYKPDDNGTIDNVIFGGADRTLYVTDLKFGRGHLVTAKGNKQLLIYAVSALDRIKAEYPDVEIENVVLTIVQPRRDYVGEWRMTVDEMELERELIESKSRKALAGGGDFKAGEHCKFCPVKPRCRHLKDTAAAMAQKEFTDPALLTNSEIAALLGQIDTIADWVAGVKTYALKQAVDGIRFEGWKVVSGVSKRSISDPKGLINALKKEGFEPALFTRTSPIPLGDLEKAIGKDEFTSICGPYITRPDAPPVLVPASDPRQEFGIAKAAEDFAEYMPETPAKN